MNLLTERNLLAAVVLLSIFYVVGIASYPISYDEGAFNYYAQQLNKGAQPYVDFLEYKTPGIFYFDAMIFRIFGADPVFTRLITVLISFSTLYLFYKMILKFFNKKTALTSLVLILSARSFLDSNVTAYVEPISTFFIMLGAYFLIRQKSNINLILSGVMFGLAFWFKQTALLSLGAVILYFLLHKDYRKAVIVAATTAVVIAPIFLLYPKDMIYLLFIFGTQVNNMDLFTKVKIWLTYLLPVMWLGYIYIMKEYSEKRFDLLSLLLVIPSLGFLTLKEVWGHTFNQIVIFAGYFAALYLNEISKIRQPLVNAFIGLVLLANIAAFVQFAYVHDVSCLIAGTPCSSSRSNQMEVVNFMADKQGTLFSDSPMFYYLLDRKSLTLIPGVIGAYVSVFGLSDLVPTLESKNVEYIISMKVIYAEKLKSYGITDYIEAKYQKVFENGDYYIFERKP